MEQQIPPADDRLHRSIKRSLCRLNFLHGFATVSCPLLHIHSTTPIPPFGTLLGRCGSLRPTSCLTLRHGYRGPQVIFCYPYILLNGINKYLNSFISIRARHLHFHADHTEELGNILLRISALGMFAYSVFSMIAGALTNSVSNYEPPVLVFFNGLLSLIEVAVQTLYISDMTRRSVKTAEDNREKPGRQSVTFLLITNMTLWLVYTFEMQKVLANPVQLNFYGFLPWAIIQRLTIPLCIFYRFHSAIVYSEIWKNSYRYHAHQQ